MVHGRGKTGMTLAAQAGRGSTLKILPPCPPHSRPSSPHCIMVPLSCRRRRRRIPSIAYILPITVTNCTSFTCRTSFATSMNIAKQRTIAAATTTQLYYFHDLVLDDDEDLRTDIVTIDEKSGLDIFLKQDERICVIKFYAPFCKAVTSFVASFVN